MLWVFRGLLLTEAACLLSRQNNGFSWVYGLIDTNSWLYFLFFPVFISQLCSSMQEDKLSCWNKVCFSISGVLSQFKSPILLGVLGFFKTSFSNIIFWLSCLQGIYLLPCWSDEMLGKLKGLYTLTKKHWFAFLVSVEKPRNKDKRFYKTDFKVDINFYFTCFW